MTRHHPTWSEVRPHYMGALVPIGATCAICRWWRPLNPSDDTGECCYRPPANDGRPQTTATDLCSEWETDYQPVDRNGNPCEAGPLWAARHPA